MHSRIWRRVDHIWGWKQPYQLTAVGNFWQLINIRPSNVTEWKKSTADVNIVRSEKKWI